MERIKAAIAGGAGYTGGELIRLLLGHPRVDIVSVHSKSNAGNPLHQVHQDLLGQTDMRFSGETDKDVDVLFLCLGHGESHRYLDENDIPDRVRVIDLSQDFRLPDTCTHGDRRFTYGLPECNRGEIGEAHDIANPGCFATAIQLALLPAAHHGLPAAVHVTGITGSTGAGQGLSASSHFSWRANNIQPYKSLRHQHLLEIGATLRRLQPLDPPRVHFVPWRGDFTRGIFVSAQMHWPTDKPALADLYREYYAGHPFTHVSDGDIFLKQVVNTNNCVIQVETNNGQAVVHAAIDNLLKGASGQAVQNMNLLFGRAEDEGLRLKANYF